MGRMMAVSALLGTLGAADSEAVEVSTGKLSLTWEVQAACYWRGMRETTLLYKNSDEDMHMSYDVRVT